MKCPECSSTKSKVLDSRERDFYVYRRRECRNGHRFATYELHSKVNGAQVLDTEVEALRAVFPDGAELVERMEKIREIVKE